MELTEKTISKRLIKYLYKKGHKYLISNVFVYRHESDVFSVTKSGYSYEFEIKISVSDFKADMFKKDKHKFLSSESEIIIKKIGNLIGINIDGNYVPNTFRNKLYSGYEGSRIDYLNRDNEIPNRFFYIVPEDMISPDQVPEYAGLYYIKQNGGIIEIKKAPLLHKKKQLEENLMNILLDKYFYYYLNNKIYTL